MDSMYSWTCFFCKAKTAKFYRGWKLKNGSFAPLCDKCGSAYVHGVFCETHHKELDGWRDCSICQKPLHCGCVMSNDMYAPLDLGGVACLRCLHDVGNSITSEQMRNLLKETVAKNKEDRTVLSDASKGDIACADSEKTPVDDSKETSSTT